ncbi:Gfo/Idh/MocA family protein [Actinomadura chibensis]|uniref:Gfo/Idh/MocA family oxidoreductase n=1 Tax=Actinomadura chibensis TaxID=392828 RepID=A0A5D0NUQ6_9ACTN|nr:Gfo/Idh/MocA family oxidoreductase [Actinomadura chibensis]TYB47989.1 Gfo/Idh/MocA family oxidoreductase [Actinomadura chibensis]
MSPSAGGRDVLRLGVVGGADVAVRRVLPALSGVAGLELAAVASRSRAKAEKITARFGGRPVEGYDALLEMPEIDAVYIPLPSGLHAHWIGRALASGKHVLAEKPLTTEARDTERLHAAAFEAGLVLRENYMFPGHRLHARVAALLAEGLIGEIRSFDAVFAIPPRPAGDVRHRPELGGGALLDCGGYPLRAAVRFLGPDLDVLGAHLRIDPALGVDVAGAALLRAPGGASVHCEFGFDHYYASGYRFLGSAGRLAVEHVFTTPAEHEPVLRVERAGRRYEEAVAADDQFRNSLAAFAADVRAGRAGTSRATRAQARIVDRVRRIAGRTAPAA